MDEPTLSEPRPRDGADPVARIISGGQTGVDRAALDAAIHLALPYGGWCPRGGWAEDLPEPPGLLARYPSLAETPERDPAQRTRWNVRDAAATLVITAAGLGGSGGTLATVEAAAGLGRPCTVVDLDEPGAAAAARAFVVQHAGGRSLNVAGPRESERPGIGARAQALLVQVLATSEPGAVP